MKTRRGLAWLEVILVGSMAMKAEQQVADFPHLHQEDRSILELVPALSSCEFSLTGSLNGPGIPFKVSTSDPFISSADNWDDYGGSSFILC